MVLRPCFLVSALGAIALWGVGGCTTNFSSATDLHNRGDFAGAANASEELCPSTERDLDADQPGDELKPKATYDRDRVWIAVEKAKVLSDDGRGQSSARTFDYAVWEGKNFREEKSRFEANISDTSSWDAGLFAEGAGQSVFGADQTTFMLQPSELLLAKSYALLNALLSGGEFRDRYGVGQGAKQLVRWQDETRLDESDGQLKPADVQRMDAIVRGKVPAGKTTSFSVGGILSLGDFTAAKKSMAEAVQTGKSMRCADQSIAFATAVNWACFMNAGMFREAQQAGQTLARQSGQSETTDNMQKWSTAGETEPEWVLVLIETGRGPNRGYFNVRFPILIPSVGATEFRGVYPYLKFRADGRPTDVAVMADQTRTPVNAVTSIDAIASLDFQRRERELWWIPTVRGALRAVAAIVAQAVQKKDDNTTRLIIGLASIIVAEAEQPDVRCWSTLPAAQHVALIRRPASGSLTISLASGVTSSKIEVPDLPRGGSLVYLRALETTKCNQVRVAGIRSLEDIRLSSDSPSAMESPSN